MAAAKEAGSSLNWSTPGAGVTCDADDWNMAGSDVSCTVNYPMYFIDVLGMVVADGVLTSVTTERLE